MPQHTWSLEEVESQLNQLKNGTLKGTYGVNIVNTVSDLVFKMDLKGKSVLVIGSERPWLEVIALAAGAGSVTTLEYGEILSQHPQISTITPKDFRSAYLEDKLPLFDAVLSFSSLEHSGLGRCVCYDLIYSNVYIYILIIRCYVLSRRSSYA